MIGERSVVETIQTLLERRPVRNRLDLDVAGRGVRVRSDSSELTDSLRRYFAPFLQPVDHPCFEVHLLEAPVPDWGLSFQPFLPEPGKTRIKEEFVDLRDGRIVRKPNSGLTILLARGWNVAVGPCLKHVHQTINFINNRFIQTCVDEGYLMCHAAGVSRDGRGIGLAGMSGRGKSTLALRLITDGWNFASNDRLLIRRRGAGWEMRGLPKAPRVNPGTLLNNPRLRSTLTDEERASLERLPDEELWTLERKYDVDVERLFGTGRVEPRTGLVGFILLNWRRVEAPPAASRVDLEGRPDLLRHALMKQVNAQYLHAPDAATPVFSERDYVHVFKGLPVLEITGGVDFDRAMKICDSLLDPRRDPF